MRFNPSTTHSLFVTLVTALPLVALAELAQADERRPSQPRSPVDVSEVVVIDMTVGHQLAGLPGVEPGHEVTAAYPHLEFNKYEKFTREVLEAADKNRRFVMFDYEKTDRGELIAIDPHYHDMEDIVHQHRLYARSLASVEPLADRLQVHRNDMLQPMHVGIYRFATLTHRNYNRITGGASFRKWQADQRRVLSIEINERGETLLDVIRGLEGHFCWSCYLHDVWTKKSQWGRIKLLLGRIKETLDELGAPNLPVLKPYSIGGHPVPPEMWQWQFANLSTEIKQQDSTLQRFVIVWDFADGVPQKFKDWLRSR